MAGKPVKTGPFFVLLGALAFVASQLGGRATSWNGLLPSFDANAQSSEANLTRTPAFLIGDLDSPTGQLIVPSPTFKYPTYETCAKVVLNDLQKTGTNPRQVSVVMGDNNLSVVGVSMGLKPKDPRVTFTQCVD